MRGAIERAQMGGAVPEDIELLQQAVQDGRLALAPIERPELVSTVSGQTRVEEDGQGWVLRLRLDQCLILLKTALAGVQQRQKMSGDEPHPPRGREGWLLYWLGLGHHRLGEIRQAQAEGEQALAISRELGDRTLEAGSLILLGELNTSQREAHRALATLEQARAVAQKQGESPAGAADTGYGSAGLYLEWLRLSALGLAQVSAADFRLGMEALEQALAVAQKMGDRQAEAGTLGRLGNAYAAQRDGRRAMEYGQQYLALARQLGDRYSEVTALANVAGAYLLQRDGHSALEHYEHALAIAQEIGDHSGECSAWHSLAGVYASQRDFERAQAYFKQVLARAREVGDRYWEASSLSSLANVALAKGERPQAVAYQEEALNAARQAGDRVWEVYLLGALGSTYSSLGDARRTAGYVEQHLELVRQTGDQRAVANDLLTLGLTYALLDEPGRAAPYLEQHLAFARQIGDRQGESNDLGNLGMAYQRLGDTRRAMECYQQHLHLAQAMQDRLGEESAWDHIGSAHAAQGETELAIAAYERQLAMAREIRDRRGEAQALKNLGQTYCRLAEEPQAIREEELSAVSYQLSAIRAYEQALAIYREGTDQAGASAILDDLGEAYIRVGDSQRALATLEQSRVQARKRGDAGQEARVAWTMGRLYEGLGEYEQAVGLMQVVVEYERATGQPAATKHAAHLEQVQRQAAESPAPPTPGGRVGHVTGTSESAGHLGADPLWQRLLRRFGLAR